MSYPEHVAVSGAQESIVFASRKYHIQLYYIHIIFVFSISDADVAAAQSIADYLRYRGSLIIILMGTDVDASRYLQLSPYVYEWRDSNNPPATLVDDILSSFSCGKSNFN
jgi:hypothetical protein